MITSHIKKVGILAIIAEIADFNEGVFDSRIELRTDRTMRKTTS